jgi:hypothetical protein
MVAAIMWSHTRTSQKLLRTGKEAEPHVREEEKRCGPKNRFEINFDSGKKSPKNTPCKARDIVRIKHIIIPQFTKNGNCHDGK